MMNNKQTPDNKSSRTSHEPGSTEQGSTRHSPLPGLILVLLLGGIALILSTLPASLDALALGIVLGIAARFILGSAASGRLLASPFIPGASLGVRIFLPIGIILYGINLDFSQVIGLPANIILLTLLCMLFFYIMIYWLNFIVWKIKPRVSELIATGSAVCGASAIAVLFPTVEGEPEDISVSLLVVTAAGLLGVMAYPVIKLLTGMPDTTYAIFSGATLHEPGLVQATVASLSAGLGAPSSGELGSQELIDFAMAVKTIRIVMLAPIAVATSFINTWRTGRTQFGRTELARSLLSLRRVWFLLPFVLLGLLVSSVPAVRDLLAPFSIWAKFVFTLALASIGFSVDIESVLLIGSRPLFVGLLGWISVVIFFLLISPIFI